MNTMLKEKLVTVDKGKRGRLVILAIVVGVSIFGFKAIGWFDYYKSWQLILKSLGYFAFTYISLLWAFRFNLNKRSLLLVIPQSALLAAACALFVDTFFFRSFARVSEFLLLFIVMLMIVIGLYVSFLMSNIFNVSMFKDIPLKQVAKTTSYIITLMLVYLLSFSFLSFQLNIIYTLILLALVYFVALLTHLYHLNVSVRDLTSTVSVVLVSMIAAVSSAFFIGNRHEVIALMPTAVAFSSIGIIMHKNRAEQISGFVMFQYIAVFVAIMLLNIFYT